MAAPLFVNAGTADSDFFDSSSTPALPGSRVNGNLLIALIAASGTAAIETFTFPAGWTTIGTPIATTSGNSALAWRLVDGSETAPNITLSSSNSLQAQVFQYSGVFGTSPIGSVHRTKNSSNVTAVADDGVNVTANNSRVAVFICGGNSGGLSTPSGYTADSTPNPSFILHSFSQTTPNDAGEASTPVAATAGNSSPTLMAWSVEIKSEAAPAGADNLTATPFAGASPSIGSPTIGQKHALTATAIAGASPSLGTPSINTVTVDFTANPFAGASPSIGSPTLGQKHALTATLFAGASPSLGTPSVEEVILPAPPIQCCVVCT